MKTYIPTFHAASIYDIPMSFYEEWGIHHVFADLDNTLDSYQCKTASEKAKNLKRELEKNGITLYVISNNTSKRVGKYADSLNCPYLFHSGKPFAARINRYIREKGIKKEEILLVGDQLMTDVPAGNRLRIKVCLTEKIVEEDQWTTHFNRFFDNILRRRYVKKGILADKEVAKCHRN